MVEKAAHPMLKFLPCNTDGQRDGEVDRQWLARQNFNMTNYKDNKDNIMEWTGLKLGEALRKAENREEW